MAGRVGGTTAVFGHDRRGLYFSKEVIPYAAGDFGQIVVARIDEEITIKEFQRHAQGIRLLPRNQDYAPIEVRPDQDFAIEGLYCGLIRPGA